VAILALVALRVRLWRSERELTRMRRGLAQPVYPADPVSSWGSRPAR
jgi:hypothetical protein